MKRVGIAVVTGIVVIGLLAAGVGLPRVWSRLTTILQPSAGLRSEVGAPTQALASLFCSEHGVPERFCTLCHAELASQLLMCAEHGLPEEICTLCHSDAVEKHGLTAICQDHGLPESFCRSCQSAVSLGGDGAEQDLPVVTLKSEQITKDAGIEVAPVQAAQHVATIVCNGEVIYNQNRFAEVRPRVEGFVREVRWDVGAEVRAGDVLAVVDSARVGEAKGDYLAALALVELAQKNFSRVQSLTSRGIVAEKNFVEAENRLKEVEIHAARAREKLLNLGFSAAQIEQFLQSQDTGSLLAVTAPLDGTIVRRRAVEGEAVEPATVLFAVADLKTMWVYLDIYEKDLENLPQVRPGQRVTFTVEGLQPYQFPGRVTWVSPEVDPRTRTVRVRAEVDNSTGLLRAHMFGKGEIEISEPHEALVVPKESVQTYGDSEIVFVKKSGTVYEPRRVKIAHWQSSFCEVAEGLVPGEWVVTTGSFLFKTELMRGSIGAGCCE